MTDFRVWHASRDPYHCAYRMVRVLVAQAAPIALERLRVLDMLLLYPPLLQRLRLATDLKRTVRDLAPAQSERTFVRLPSVISIWQDLQVYQSAALKHLAGRGLLRREALMERYANLDEEQVPEEILRDAVAANQEQKPLLSFLIDGLAQFPDRGKDGLMDRAHLPARGAHLEFLSALESDARQSREHGAL